MGETSEPLANKHIQYKENTMKIGKATKTRHLWVYPFTVLIAWPAFIFAEVPATSSNDKKITNPTEADVSHRGSFVEIGSENNPVDLHDDWDDEEIEYGEPEDNEVIEVIEDDDGDRVLVFHPAEKRAPYQDNFLRLDKKFSTLLRLDKKANYNPSSFNSMLRLDKKANYNPSFNSMLRLDKKYSPNNFNAFSNQLRLDKKSFKSSLRNFGLLRLD